MARLSARFTTLIHEADRREIPRRAGATSLISWLTSGLSMAGPEAGRWAKLAKLLHEVPIVEEALAAGHLTTEQARVIAQTITDLPKEVGEQGKLHAADVLT